MKIENILQCPLTGNSMYYSESENCYKVQNSNFEYSVIDDVIYFLKPNETNSQNKSIPDSYKKMTGVYDSLLTRSNIITKLLFKSIWGIDDKYDSFIQNNIDQIPDDFNGVLLDVPVGTAVFTVDKYKKLKNATIIVLEFSLDMLFEAKRKYSLAGIKNVIYIHGDVARLPFKDNSVDCTLSMNGFHCFPDKEKALHEISRTLKTNGQFTGCFYVKGRRVFSDIHVKILYSPMKLFVAPYYTGAEVMKMFGKYFTLKAEFYKSFIFFSGRKIKQ